MMPPNTTASICVPTSDATKITESGKPASAARATTDYALYEVRSGSYEFISPFGQ